MNPSDAVAAKLREQIFQKIKEYYLLTHGLDQPFIAGSRVPFAGRFFDENEIINAVQAALEFWLTEGHFTNEFEKQLSDFIGVKDCVFVNSGSSANLLAFAALTSPKLGSKRIMPGDEIITVAAAFPTTIAPIIQFGAVPVFVDIELDSYNINSDLLNDALSERTKGVFIAHCMGHPFNVVEVVNFCRKYDLWLVEDNCDALGSKYGGQRTGSFGHLSTASFYPAHHITTGEGGAVFSNDEGLIRIVRSFRDWGRDCWCKTGHDNSCGKRFDQRHGELPYGYDHKYVYSHFGFNLKATDLQAAIGCAQLQKLPHIVKQRRANHQILSEGLRDLEDFFYLPKSGPNCEPSWFGFLLRIRNGKAVTRTNVMQFLEKRSIQTRVLFSGNILKHPCFTPFLGDEKYYRIVGDLHCTNEVMNDTFWVGVYPGLSSLALESIIEALHDFVGEYGR